MPAAGPTSASAQAFTFCQQAHLSRDTSRPDKTGLLFVLVIFKVGSHATAHAIGRLPLFGTGHRDILSPPEDTHAGAFQIQ